jgi:hypothetical protein
MQVSNDGGIGIQYTNPLIPLQLPSVFPPTVVALEAKRKHSLNQRSIDLQTKFAGQIFCEMLCQVCIPEIIERSLDRDQEVHIY